MWVTKLLIFPVEIRIFCPKTTKFGPKLAFLINLGQAMQASSVPGSGSVGGCGARAVSRKTPIYFIYVIYVILVLKLTSLVPLHPYLIIAPSSTAFVKADYLNFEQSGQIFE